MPESGRSKPDLLLLGRAIRAMREQRGLAAHELASASGIDRGRIDALEAGLLDPTYEMLLALAHALGVQPSALVITAERIETGGEA